MQRHQVVAVVEDEVSPYELSVACEVFGADRSFLRDPWYSFTVASPGRSPLRTDLGMQILPDDDLSALALADTVIVAAGGKTDGPSRELVDAIRAAHDRGARIVSLCTGAFILAAAGLLDGRRATTHWAVADELAELHPDIEVDPAVLYVDEGDVLTSAGAAASMDLCLHIVRADFGADIANALARRIVVPPHRAGGQAQFVETPVDTDEAPDTLSQVMDWAVEHLNEELTIVELSRRAAMSERTFARRFRAATGTTPYQWLLGQRVALAQRLLETTDVPVEVIATRAGFGSPAAMRMHFQRIAATSPQSYRRAFRHPESA